MLAVLALVGARREDAGAPAGAGLPAPPPQRPTRFAQQAQQGNNSRMSGAGPRPAGLDGAAAGRASGGAAGGSAPAPWPPGDPHAPPRSAPGGARRRWPHAPPADDAPLPDTELGSAEADGDDVHMHNSGAAGGDSANDAADGLDAGEAQHAGGSGLWQPQARVRFGRAALPGAGGAGAGGLRGAGEPGGPLVEDSGGQDARQAAGAPPVSSRYLARQMADDDEEAADGEAIPGTP